LAGWAAWPNNLADMLTFQLPSGSDELALLAAPRRRLAWLIRLRWWALFGIVLGSVLAASGVFPGVNWQVLALAATSAAVYNGALARAHQKGTAATDPRAALGQALADFLLLTIVLWASGGVRSPFIGYYAFHVALAGILAGARGTMVAAVAALGCACFLLAAELVPALHISDWGARGSVAVLANIAAFTSTVAGIAYIVTHAASELRDREDALSRARDRARLEYEVLSTTLDELDAGLEIVDGAGKVLFKNQKAQRLVPTPHVDEVWHCPGDERACERDVSGQCPLERSFEHGQAGRCRFAVSLDGGERLYELHSFPLTSSPRDARKVMNLYIDRTNAMLSEQQLILAERLSSLGRIAQGVAHELNTPLATIRTLGADMVAALESLRAQAPQAEALLKDLSESASLIHEETGRLGRITHSLLAGGDLVRAQIDGSVPLSAVLERGRALVLAGARAGSRVDIDASVDGVAVTADPDRLLQVIVNLVQNAADAVRARPNGLVTIAVVDEVAGDVAIHVDDNGPGISPNIRARLFEPFATTKPQGEGTGLGLYTSYMLVQGMHGTLTLDDRNEGGTRATLRLPRGRKRLASERALGAAS
jgi:signal transduction histidine kinase